MVTKARPWYRDVAAVMIRERMPLRAALSVLGLAVSNAEIEAVEHSAGFLKALDDEQARFYSELAQSPNFSKMTVVGGMLHAINQLTREGAFDKAVEAWFKLARVQDWVGGEAETNIYMGITQKDIDLQREKLAQPARVQ